MKFKDHYFLTETLSNELVYLKRYLNSSVKEKAINRAFNNSYLIKDYFESNEDKYREDFDEMEDYEIVDWLNDNDQETLIDFGEYVVDDRNYLQSDEMELFDIVGYETFVRQQWLVHFSDRASDISNDQQFKVGIPYEDYERLALTTSFKDSYKTGGFNFAYEIDDVKRHAFNRGRPKYGKEAVLFKGDGIKVFHSGDDEPQVIFDGQSTKKPIIHIQYDNDVWFIESKISDERLIEKEDIVELAHWVDKNYDQYRKHL